MSFGCCMEIHSTELSHMMQGRNAEVILVPREAWPDHRSFRVPVACDRPLGDGVRVQGEATYSLGVTRPRRDGSGLTGAKDSAATRLVKVFVMWTYRQLPCASAICL